MTLTDGWRQNGTEKEDRNDKKKKKREDMQMEDLHVSQLVHAVVLQKDDTL